MYNPDSYTSRINRTNERIDELNRRSHAFLTQALASRDASEIRRFMQLYRSCTEELRELFNEIDNTLAQSNSDFRAEFLAN